MRIAYVIDKYSYLENFSIPIIASISKRAGHKTIVVEYESNKKGALELLKKYKPDIIGYSVTSHEANKYLEINSDLKKNIDFFSIFGGPHPTFFPDYINEKGVDAICRGEADIAYPKFLNNFGKKSLINVENFSFNINGKIIENPIGNLVADLDSLPFPDRDIIYENNSIIANFPMKAFFAGRGCPFNCSYCFNHVFNKLYLGKGRILRTKSVEYLIKEIKSVRKKYPMNFIKFHDDIFGLDRRWLEEFSEIYPKKIGLPFLCYARANIITDDYCRLLKKSGCRSISLAIECGNETLRNKILHRNMSNKQIVEGCRIVKQYGIKLYILNMIGLPEENLIDMYTTIKMNSQIHADFADASIFQPYPGTDITQYCIEKGYFNGNTKNFESQFSKSILNFSEDFKAKIYILHKFFSILVDYPKLFPLIDYLYKTKNNKILMKIYNYIYRLYYGYFLHKRIYGFRVPLKLRMEIGIPVLFSRSRS